MQRFFEDDDVELIMPLFHEIQEADMAEFP